MRNDSLTTRHEWVLFTLAFVTVCLATGTVYGWPALRRELVLSGGLSETQLGGIFTAGSWSVQGGRFITGIVRDSIGTKLTVCTILLIVVGGAITVGSASSDNSVALGCGMFMLGLGSGAQLCLQPVAALFPAHSSACMASLSGAFQVSGMVFLVISFIGRERGFVGFAVVILCLATVSWFLLPSGKSFILEDSRPSAGFPDKIALVNIPVARSEGICNGSTKWEQFLSREYAALILWFSVAVTPAQFYVLSIGYQLELKGDDQGRYMQIFLLIFALGAPISPLVGMVADKVGVGASHGLAASTLAVSLAFLAAPAEWAIELQIVGFIFYSIGRLSVWGIFFSNIGRRFGFANYGWLAGFGLLVSAVVSIVQYPLFQIAIHGGSQSVDISLTAALICTFPYAIWLGGIEHQETKLKSPNQPENEQMSSL
jgi:MFS transporter, LAT3 family, solute carrier family 43, member 3